MTGGQGSCPHKNCLAAIAQTFPHNSFRASFFGWPDRSQSAKPVSFVNCRLPPAASAACGKTGIKFSRRLFTEITAIALANPKGMTPPAVFGFFQNDKFSEASAGQILLLLAAAANRIGVQMPGGLIGKISAVTLTLPFLLPSVIFQNGEPAEAFSGKVLPQPSLRCIGKFRIRAHRDSSLPQSLPKTEAARKQTPAALGYAQSRLAGFQN